MDEFARGKLELTATELAGEREEALSVCQDWLYESNVSHSTGSGSQLSHL